MAMRGGGRHLGALDALARFPYAMPYRSRERKEPIMRGWKRWSLVLALLVALAIGLFNGGGGAVDPKGHAPQSVPALAEGGAGGSAPDPKD